MTNFSILQGKKVAFFTLGCKLNFAETSTIGHRLAEMGTRTVRDDEVADICVVNTCSVTSLADKGCRQAIRQLIKRHPGALVAVTGCYAQLKPDEVDNIPGVTLVVGAERKMELPKLIAEAFTPDIVECPIQVTPYKEIRSFAPACSADDRTRHFLKVQDGCDYFCSYCTIPFARGRSRNGSIHDLTEEARRVAATGGREIVLTGVNIGDFGKTTGESFLDLIHSLDEVEGIERYRISSLEPDLLTDEIIGFVAKSKRFAPHFHIPLQSGCDETLRRMRRRYDTSLFAHKIEHIKELMPDAFIGVDVIVGFRGETDKDFETTYRFLESLDVTQLHVFPYSERPGTLALRITPVVDASAKHTRAQRLLALSETKWQAFYDAHRGVEAHALFEQPKVGAAVMHGFTENYIRVEVAADPSRVNQTIPVTLLDWNDEQTALRAQFLSR